MARETRSVYIFIIAERLSARHLILQHALGQCMYVCPSRSSTHARKDGGGVTRESSSLRVGWIAEVREACLRTMRIPSNFPSVAHEDPFVLHALIRMRARMAGA